MPWHNGLLNELLLTISQEGSWEDTFSRIEAKLEETKNSQMGRSSQLTLYFSERAVAYEALEALVQMLKIKYGLLTVAVVSSDKTTQEAARRLTLNAYTMLPGSNLATPANELANGNNALFVPNTVRSGQRVTHTGTLIVGSDVNAGAEVAAEGDIIVFGTLRGLAHAGSAGNEKARIVAGIMRPQQLRIAHHIARAPEESGAPVRSPEVAQVVGGAIQVSPY